MSKKAIISIIIILLVIGAGAFIYSNSGDLQGRFSFGSFSEPNDVTDEFGSFSDPDDFGSFSDPDEFGSFSEPESVTDDFGSFSDPSNYNPY